jgi:hypothetical protein
MPKIFIKNIFGDIGTKIDEKNLQLEPPYSRDVNFILRPRGDFFRTGAIFSSNFFRAGCDFSPQIFFKWGAIFPSNLWLILKQPLETN